MTVERLLDLLEGVRRDGQGGFFARCPGHEDGNPSLHVTPRAGRILIHCFAGCEAERVLRVLELRWRDLRDAR
jgi:putative DNA primase/helicase